MAVHKPISVGTRFARWVVLEEVVVPDRIERYRYRCRCDCGTEKLVRGYNLRRGESLSCGCLIRDTAPSLRHGYARKGQVRPEYRAWQHMLRRCTDTENPSYPAYGGRGIRVCERWRSFENFLSDMGPRPAGCSLDRINNDGNYEPSNCRWATIEVQMNNTRTNVFVSAFGERLTIAQWSRRVGISRLLLRERIVRGGWPPELALSTPPIAPRDRLAFARSQRARAAASGAVSR